MDVRKRLQEGFLLLDGGFGTLLQTRGLLKGNNTAVMSIMNPDAVSGIHREYIEAGSEIIIANTFSANEYKLNGTGYTVEEVIKASLNAAKKAINGTPLPVALDLGPIGELLEPLGSLSFEAAVEVFKRQIACGVQNGADIIYLETMTDLYEVKAALLAAKETCDLPVFCTMSFEANGRTFMGTSLQSFALTAQGLGADAIGINCSLGPAEILPMAKRLAEFTSLPVIAKPNAGLPDPNSILPSYDVDSNVFADILSAYADFGVTVFGGCCGTTPDYIRHLKSMLAQKRPVKRTISPCSAVCSPSRAVIVDGVTVIGERINPTGKKIFKEALENDDLDYILTQGITQADAGAHILDVNVGLPTIDEKSMMVKVIKGLQSVVDLPLQIDSSDPLVLEAALRVYNGKALVNSVNGEERSLRAVLPLVKKYGASVVGLTLDEKGIPDTAEGRLDIARKIVKAAEEYGISKEDVFIDCLTLTISAQQDKAAETLRAVELVKAKLGVKTVLGVSNVSFGLPNRELINSSFLLLALSRGLDLPIINPNAKAMTDVIDAFLVLANRDSKASNFIERHGGTAKEPSTLTQNRETDLGYAVLKGLKEDVARITRELLTKEDPMTVINGYLIPALDETGTLYEKGVLFLPQLIQSAEAAKAGFSLVKEHLASSGFHRDDQRKIILATVQGDIHDIGKNIVKVILENYGYRVIDLGKDVPPDVVVSEAKRHSAGLVGLSALMTTTLKNMEATIARLKEETSCAVVVGGAVLTADYAAKIGADHYAKDAKEAVDIAKIVFQ